MTQPEMTQRVGFVLRVEPDRVDEYVLAHREVWPEKQEVNSRWQDAMADLLEERVQDQGPAPLEAIFRLA
jgi:L-rhamnose mutarotase